MASKTGVPLEMVYVQDDRLVFFLMGARVDIRNLDAGSMRFFHSSPLKNVLTQYSPSHLSDAVEGAMVSPESLSKLLRSLGLRRERAVGFMSSFVAGSRQAVIDLTHFFSLSERLGNISSSWRI